MAINYPGPYGLRMFYTTLGLSIPIQHVAEYNIDLVEDPAPIGNPFSGYTAITRDASNMPLDDLCDAWAALVRPHLNQAAGNTIDYFELWKYTPLSFDAVFMSSYNIGLNGTSASAITVAGQDIWVYRTGLGGIMKLNFMESVAANGAKDTLPLAAAHMTAIHDHILGPDNAFIGRDGGMPFALIARYPGVSEALSKRRYRS